MKRLNLQLENLQRFQENAKLDIKLYNFFGGVNSSTTGDTCTSGDNSASNDASYNTDNSGTGDNSLSSDNSQIGSDQPSSSSDNQ